MAKIDGTNGGDTLYGTGAADTINGLGGNDTLKGFGGADRLDGGTGIDTAFYSDSAVGVAVNLATGSGVGGSAEGDRLLSIENVFGSDHNDTLIGDNNNNALTGLGGNDFLKGAGGSDRLNGGDGADNLKGGGGSDVLLGDAGDDILDGGSGEDTMIGGLGNDTYLVDNPDDHIIEFGGQGIDVVRTSTGYELPEGADVETLETTDANGTVTLHLFGNSSGNQIIGNNGFNYIYGRGGTDEMVGRGGDDFYYVEDAGDSIVESGGQGTDVVYAYVSYTLTAGADVEFLRTGTDAAIDLTGNASGNEVSGNDRNNVLNGGGGRDTLTGFGGQDSFLFNTALDAATNVDEITDFNVAADTILLDDAVFTTLTPGGLAAGQFVVGTAAQDADDRIIYDSGTRALFYDSDGAGGAAAVQFAELGPLVGLSPGLDLTNLDFLVV
jgi:Ca2+-binding RTX toxin-like protein